MKKWIQSLVYTQKHEKPTDENIVRLLMPSFVGIIICMACLAGASWAWFTASIQSPLQTITAANYNIDVYVTDADGTPIEQERGGYSFYAGGSYNVKLTATGTSPCGGYCVVKGGVDDMHTNQLRPGETLDITLNPEQDGFYTFTTVWGNYSGAPDLISDNTSGQNKPNATAKPSTNAPNTTSKPSTNAPSTTSKPSTSTPNTTSKPSTNAPNTTSKPSTSAPNTTSKPSTNAPNTTSKPSGGGSDSTMFIV